MADPSQNTFDMSDFAGNWRLDPARTSIEFHTRALWLVPTKGTFPALEGVGTVTTDGAISGTVIIDAASVDTGHPKRDVHLRAADFLDVGQFPTIIYEATNGTVGGPGTIDLQGTLTVRGASRPLAVSAYVRSARDAVTFWAEVAIDRSAWGLTSTSFGAGLTNRVFVRAQFDKLAQR